MKLEIDLQAFQNILIFYQACLRPRDRFWDIPVPKIDSAFDNLIGAPAVLVTKHYATTSQARCCSVLGSQ
ncbi:hypothetical protein [Thiolapillus sp.]|uniref:hypothetical protein n=1 Tax=Thiolapillus sp. TaxID=2017437 RepID=UPI003AF4F8AD